MFFMFREYLYDLPEVILVVTLIGILFFAMEVCFLLGRHFAEKVAPSVASQISTHSGAQLGFLALLIGFTFSMALSRFDARTKMLNREVNDIGSLSSRIGNLDEKSDLATRQLLAVYADLRVAHFWESLTQTEDDNIVANTDLVENELVRVGIHAAKQPELAPPLGASYLSLLTGVLSDRTERMLTIDNHVPEPVLWLLLLISLITVSMNGFTTGLNKVRSPIVRWVLIFSIVVTLMTIIDLDRPRRGIIRISQMPMVSLAQKLHQNVGQMQKISPKELRLRYAEPIEMDTLRALCPAINDIPAATH